MQPTRFEKDLGGNPFADAHYNRPTKLKKQITESKGKASEAAAAAAASSNTPFDTRATGSNTTTKWMFGTRGFTMDDVTAFRPLSPTSRPTSPVGRLLKKAVDKSSSSIIQGPYEQTPLLQQRMDKSNLQRLGPLKNWQSFVQGTEADQERRTASGFQDSGGPAARMFLSPNSRRKRRLVRAINDTEDGPTRQGDEREETSWLLLRPSKTRIDKWLDTWWRRWFFLVGLPCLIVWAWCAVPFPVSDPFKEQPPWNLPWPGEPPPNNSFVVSSPQLRLPTRAPIVSVIDSGDVQRSTMASVDVVRSIEADPNRDTVQVSGHKTVHVPSDPAPPTPPAGDDLPVDANFYFFLFAYYGIYLAVALIFITKLFDLYRLNWWPSTLGGSVSYLMFWSLSLLVGFLLHHFDLDGLGRRSHSDPRRKHDETSFDWERKTTWVLLAFFAMTLPALACFAKLRADRRNSYRRSLTAAQRTFLERQQQRMPRSYKRFLWFLLTLTLSSFVLLIGQAFATVYLSTLPHNNVDGLTYVWTWIATCNILNSASNWVLETKVRSRALVFVFRYYYFLVYHIFYRNLFARLRSPDQAFWIQLLSSSFVIVWYPMSMSKSFHRLLVWVFGVDKDWEEYAESVGTMLYLRNLSENVTMAAFLGWLTILHYGPNVTIYPFFAFDSSSDSSDPYTYKLTAIASLVIWATELGSSFVARNVIWWTYGLDVTNLGLNEFRDYPELVIACVWTSIHVCMDILLFLIKLNFR
ncbi:hypothetical protein ACM66B_000027 [Microbotryomycetes sp. NB124-2]